MSSEASTSSWEAAKSGWMVLRGAWEKYRAPSGDAQETLRQIRAIADDAKEVRVNLGRSRGNHQIRTVKNTLDALATMATELVKPEAVEAYVEILVKLEAVEAYDDIPEWAPLVGVVFTALKPILQKVRSVAAVEDCMAQTSTNVEKLCEQTTKIAVKIKKEKLVSTESNEDIKELLSFLESGIKLLTMVHTERNMGFLIMFANAKRHRGLLDEWNNEVQNMDTSNLSRNLIQFHRVGYLVRQERIMAPLQIILLVAILVSILWSTFQIQRGILDIRRNQNRSWWKELFSLLHRSQRG